MNKTSWAKGRQTFYKMVAVDEDVHDLLKEMAIEHGLQIKEMARIMIEAYSMDCRDLKQSQQKQDIKGCAD